MRDEGLKVPILLTPDFRIIDGARRLQAAYELGWFDIHAIATDTWDTIADVFKRALAAEQKGFPYLEMRWMEIYEQRMLLRESYVLGPGARSAAGQARPRGNGYTFLDIAVEPLMRVTVSELAGIVHLRRYLSEIQREKPELYDEAVKHLYELQDSGMTPWTNTKLRRMAEGQEPVALSVADPKEAKRQVLTLTRGLNILETASQELDHLGNLSAAISVADAKALHNSVRRMMVSMNRVRNRLKLLVHPDESQQERE